MKLLLVEIQGVEKTRVLAAFGQTINTGLNAIF
jgi:hypothetical protein